MVVIAEGTRKRLGNLLELQDLGPKELKGLTGPVRAWAVLRPSSVASRFEALRASGTTAVNPECCLSLPMRWDTCTAGTVLKNPPKIPIERGCKITLFRLTCDAATFRCSNGVSHEASCHLFASFDRQSDDRQSRAGATGDRWARRLECREGL
jgi:hypothetical protein